MGEWIGIHKGHPELVIYELTTAGAYSGKATGPIHYRKQLANVKEVILQRKSMNTEMDGVLATGLLPP